MLNIILSLISCNMLKILSYGFINKRKNCNINHCTTEIVMQPLNLKDIYSQIIFFSVIHNFLWNFFFRCSLFKRKFFWSSLFLFCLSSLFCFSFHFFTPGDILIVECMLQRMKLFLFQFYCFLTDSGKSNAHLNGKKFLALRI